MGRLNEDDPPLRAEQNRTTAKTQPMALWIEPRDFEPPGDFVRAAGHPLLAQILLRRGIETPADARAFLDPGAYAPAPPHELPDLSAAAARLRDAATRGERVLIWGDFDVDGQTATALFASAFFHLGIESRAYIPHRLHEGHGIRLAALRKNLAGAHLLLTCDTGVAEHEALAYARRQGVTVLVTDHHDLPPELPPADAVVDPKRLPPHHPLRELPGVGVAFKLVQEIYHLAGRPPEQVDELLDLVALGIVADVARQTRDTRYLLQRGMHRLRQTRRVGLQALMQTAQVNPSHLTTDHIGFSLGPRLNALGRLADANMAVELLTTSDMSRARILAAQLEGLNERRRLLTQQIYSAAQERIARDPVLLDNAALVLSGPGWHPGIIGIVASRLAETYNRPTVLISEGTDGRGRGSARSVPGVDIHAAITAAESLLTTHGGHPGAAGLSLPTQRIPEFRRAMSRAVEMLWDRSAVPGLAIDAVVPWDEPSLGLVHSLSALRPFGEGNPPIVLASLGLEVVSHRAFGRDRNHRRLKMRDTAGTVRDVIWWRGAEHSPPTGQFDLAYRLTASDYRGKLSLQIEFVETRGIAPPSPIQVMPAIQVVDHRSAAQPSLILDKLRAEGNVAVWAEGYTPDRSLGLPRDRLEPSPVLVVWNPPPGPRELQAVLDHVSPQIVHLFAIDAPNAAPSRFMPRLAGMIKHTLRRKESIADFGQLAALSAQRIESVREGIRLLVSQGDVRILEEGVATCRLAVGDGGSTPERHDIRARVHALLQETAAYRAFFARVTPDQLIH